GSCTEESGCLFVSQVDHFRWWIQDRIVVPRCEPVLSSVFRPSRAQRAFADQTPEALVGQYVAPRRRSDGTGKDDIFVSAEATEAVFVIERRNGNGRRRALEGPWGDPGGLEERQVRCWTRVVL